MPHARTLLRRAEAFKVGAYADERRTVGRVINVLRAIEARAFAHHGVHLISQELEVADI